MDDPIEEIVAMVLDQAEEVARLDGPRAEAWASDLLALAEEAVGPAGPAVIVERLVGRGGPGATVALLAISGTASDLVSPDLGLESDDAPPWAGALGTSTCLGVVELMRRDQVSLAFRFADAAGVEHLLLVDLDPGPPERLGEVRVAPVEVLEAVDEAGDGLRALPGDPRSAASRVARAASMTSRPPDSAVMNGRLLVVRLSPLTSVPLLPSRRDPDPEPELPPLDPEDADYALELFERAVRDFAADPDEALAGAPVEAASRLRLAQAQGDPAGVWLDASVPTDTVDSPLDIVITAVAATIRPARLSPLSEPQRDAVLTLEWADWVGALIELLRDGRGALVSADRMVDRVNRCPEVTTTVPRRDRARIEWAFGALTEHWPDMGIVDSDGALTETGQVALAPALRLAWSIAN